MSSHPAPSGPPPTQPTRQDRSHAQNNGRSRALLAVLLRLLGGTPHGRADGACSWVTHRPRPRPPLAVAAALVAAAVFVLATATYLHPSGKALWQQTAHHIGLSAMADLAAWGVFGVAYFALMGAWLALLGLFQGFSRMTPRMLCRKCGKEMLVVNSRRPDWHKLLGVKSSCDCPEEYTLEGVILLRTGEKTTETLGYWRNGRGQARRAAKKLAEQIPPHGDVD